MRRDDGLPDELVTQIIFTSVELDGNHQPYLGRHQMDPETYEFFEDDVHRDAALAHDAIQHIVARYLGREQDVGEMPVAIYQFWNALDWREPHDQPESARRFISKLEEELLECLEAFGDMQSNPGSQEHIDEFISELGDVLFCATACATIARADVESGISHEMLEVYGRAVRYPSLRHIDEEVRIGAERNDELFPIGQFPYIAKNLDNHEYMVERDLSPVQTLPLICGVISNAVSPIAEADMIAGHGIYNYTVVENLCGKLNLFVSLYAQHYADSSLEEVVSKNIAKISGRVTQGSLEDRSLRDEETL